MARSIYCKIDTSGVGYIDRAMMRAYCERILKFVSPDQAVEEASLEAGFNTLDADSDGRITLEDLARFLRNQSSTLRESEVPPSFRAYCNDSQFA